MQTIAQREKAITVVVHELPEINIFTNSPLCEEDNLQLSGSGGEKYLWTGPNNFASDKDLNICHWPIPT